MKPMKRVNPMTHEGDPPYIVNCEKWGYEREPKEPQKEFYEEEQNHELGTPHLTMQKAKSDIVLLKIWKDMGCFPKKRSAND